MEELKKDEVQQIIDEHVQAGMRAEKAGFNSVELDAESCLRLSQFLSRLNRRTDEYGGNHDNRLQIVMEIYQETLSSWARRSSSEDASTAIH